MKKQLLLLGAAFLLMTSCSKTKTDTVAPDTVTAAATSTDQPKVAGKSGAFISGSIHYTFSTAFDLPCDCGSYTDAGNFSGSGTLSHLGLSTSKIKPCLSPIYNASGTHIGDHVGVECNTLVAANGDQIIGNILPYDIMYFGTNAIGVVNIDITGGTGRFDHATGHLAGIATVHLTLGTADLTEINGIINY